ncbi:MAG: hypothetical protein A2X48_04275 [Lentisphaerae bacterium GWF2_49_21]|nr:MAG: hypothetical protein A2X48_04275 [Lentisphaerae bacterium GWF2_49_21]
MSIFCFVCGCSKPEEKNFTPSKAAKVKPEELFKADEKTSADPSSKKADANPLAFLPDPVAKIGDEKISRAEIETEFKPIIAMMKENGQLGKIPPEIWKKEVLTGINDMIATKLLSKLAEANGYKPDPALAEEEFKKITAQMPPEQVAETLEKQGMKPEVIKERIATGLAIQKWVDEKILAGIKITDEETEKFYKDNQDRFKKPETVHAFHILIKPDDLDAEKLKTMTDEEKKKAVDETKQKTLQKAQDILAKIKKGEDFAKLASENSACPSKEKGGDLGTFGKGNMVPEFEKAAFSMKPGELSDIVETKYGYHIIKLAEKNEAGVVPFAEVKNFISENLKKQKLSETVRGIIEAEKKDKKVEVLVN